MKKNNKVVETINICTLGLQRFDELAVPAFFVALIKGGRIQIAIDIKPGHCPDQAVINVMENVMATYELTLEA